MGLCLFGPDSGKISMRLPIPVLLGLLALWTIPAFATEGLYRTIQDEEILHAARAIIAGDPDAALVTIDGKGQPRIRTVTTSTPESDMTIWVATKPNTRKVSQLRNNPKVALYFNNDAAFNYVSIMGTATLHDDIETKTAKNFYPEDELQKHWPDYPNDYLLIRITPTWIEVEGHGVTGHADTWQPQGLELKVN